MRPRRWDFGGKSLTSAGGSDIFLAKYECNGQLLWVLQAGGSGDDAANDLAKHWYDEGRYVEAHSLLQPIYSWFVEGFDTPDLKDAKALLDKLRDLSDTQIKRPGGNS